MGSHRNGRGRPGGAAGDATNPIIGVNWNVSIMPFQIADIEQADGTLTYNVDSLIAGLNYIAMRKNQFGDNIVAVTMNLGELASGVLYDDLPLINAMQRVTDAGIYQSGAGDNAVDNDTAQTIFNAANDSRIIEVAATDQNNNLWVDSNYGPNTVQIAAPGVNIPVMSVGAITADWCFTRRPLRSWRRVWWPACWRWKRRRRRARRDQLKAALFKGVDKVPGLNGKVSTGGVVDALRHCRMWSAPSPRSARRRFSPIP